MANRTMRGRRSGPRRATFWESASSLALTTLTDGGTISDVRVIVSEAELDNVPAPTLVRVRGVIGVRGGSNHVADNDAVLIAFAIMVVDAKQLAVGVTAMPLPLTSNSEDFLWYGSTLIMNSPAGITDVLVASQIEVDSKAMRKVSINQALVLVTEMNQLQGVAGRDVQFGINLRMLFKR